MIHELEVIKKRLSEIHLFSDVTGIDEHSMMEIANGNKKYHEQWNRVQADLQKIEANQGLNFSEDQETKEILDVIFSIAGIATRNGSLVGDIVDDLVLVARASRVQYADAWLETIWAEYQAGRFPRIK